MKPSPPHHPAPLPAPRGRRWRLAGLLLPPLGLWRLWQPPRSLGVRLLGSLVLLAWLPLYLLLVLALWIVVTPLDLEWKGGFPPVPVWGKTVPDYDALDAHRSQGVKRAGQGGGGEVQKPRTNYWTGFRGPERDGHYREAPIRTRWPATGLTPLWKQPGGGGYGSFAVADGRAYTLEQRRADEVIAAYEVATGREIWTHAYAARFDEAMGGEGPRSTPTWDDGRLYALGATGEFHCLDAATGRVQWRTNILAQHEAANLHWAQSASPLVAGQRLILSPGGPRGRAVVAYHKETGAVLWAAGEGEAAYSSPMLARLGGESQVLVAVKGRVLGLRVEDGRVLWEFPWTVEQNDRNIAQPLILGTNRFFLSAGYGTGCAAVELTPGEPRWTARELWRNKNLKNKFTSSVLWEGHIYGLDEDILVCLDAAQGTRCWKDGRYGYGQLLLASGHLVILGGNGQLALVKADPAEWSEQARFPALQGKTWNHPALDDGLLFVRNAVEMACFDLRLGTVEQGSGR